MKNISRYKHWSIPEMNPDNLIDAVIRKRFPKYNDVDINNFLDPTIRKLSPNPLDLKNASEICDMILSASRVGIFVDYDVDGISSGAMWSIFLDTISKQHVIYFPNRTDGYGPSQISIDFFRQHKCDLILFLDCGTTACDVIDNIHDIKTCVLDHHKPGDDIAQSVIVNPYLSEQSEFYGMCTAGLSFLMIALIDKTYAGLDRRFSGSEAAKYSARKNIAMDLLDLAALGTIADCMPLIGLNRAYVRRGIEIVRTNPRPGIRALLKLMNKSHHQINASTIGYYIAACLNAAGRLDTSEIAFDLLLSDVIRADEIAQTLINLNERRKKIESEILLQAVHFVENAACIDYDAHPNSVDVIGDDNVHQNIDNTKHNANDMSDYQSHAHIKNVKNMNIIAVKDDNWHPGVVGIVAGRLKEMYNKTTFAFYKKGSRWHGSARSANHDLNYLIVQGIQNGLVDYGGGHYAAAGLCIHEDKFDQWHRWVQDLPCIKKDYVLDVDYVINAKNDLPDLASLAPFGHGHQNVKILIHGMILRYVTQYGDHLKLSFANHKQSYFAFRSATIWHDILLNSIGKSFDIVISADDAGGFIDDIRYRCDIK